MSEQIINRSCVFAVTQVSNEFACEYGELVTRRAGPDIECHSEVMCKKCHLVHDEFKQVGLDAFDYEDDLTQVPYGVWMKIQFGGLLGLQARISNAADTKSINNIGQLINGAESYYKTLDEIPYSDLVPSMKSYRNRSKRR